VCSLQAAKGAGCRWHRHSGSHIGSRGGHYTIRPGISSTPSAFRPSGDGAGSLPRRRLDRPVPSPACCPRSRRGCCWRYLADPPRRRRRADLAAVKDTLLLHGGVERRRQPAGVAIVWSQDASLQHGQPARLDAPAQRRGSHALCSCASALSNRLLPSCYSQWRGIDIRN
jgi:hypothetical protein